MSLGCIDINSFVKFAIQVRSNAPSFYEPPLNEIEFSICEYIQDNIKFPIFKNYDPTQEYEDTIWKSILVTCSFEEIESFLRENAEGFSSYRVVNARLTCRNDINNYAA